jgi:branched-chain amino acid transport system substrate-binding protein
VACALILAACSSSSGSSATTSGQKTSGTVHLAWIGDLTGPVAGLGVPTNNGFLTYVAQVNASGGVNGKNIVVDTLNDNSDINMARVDLQQAQSNGDLGVYGGMASQLWGPLAASAATSKMLQLTVGVTDNEIYPPKPYVYRSQLGSQDFVSTQIGFIQQDLIAQKKVPAKPKVAIFMYSSATTQTMDTLFNSEFKKLGWPVVADVSITTTATNASTQAAQVAAAKPDVVVSAWLDSDAPFIMQALTQQGYSGPVVDFVGADAQSTFKAINNPQYFADTAYIYPTDTTVAGAVNMLKWANKSGHSSGTTSPFFTQGYVQAILAVDALKKCGSSCTPVSLNSATNTLGNVNVFGLGFNVGLTPTRHVAAGASRFYSWDNQGQTVVAAGPWITIKNP